MRFTQLVSIKQNALNTSDEAVAAARDEFQCDCAWSILSNA
jgi:hypothetical protein